MQGWMTENEKKTLFSTGLPFFLTRIIYIQQQNLQNQLTFNWYLCFKFLILIIIKIFARVYGSGLGGGPGGG